MFNQQSKKFGMDKSTNENISISNVSSLSRIKETFKKKTGTTDIGKDYENAVMANIVLQYIFDDISENFLVWSNDEKFGAFDDVILQSNLKCAIQLKHVTGKNRALTLDSFKADKGNFSIKKYFESFKQNQDFLSDFDLIIFTNQKFTPDKDQKLLLFDEEAFQVQIVEVDCNPVINSTEENQKCFKFEIIQENCTSKVQDYERFFKKFFVYTNQMDVTALEKNIYKQMEETFSCKKDIAKNYLDFFTNWNLVEGSKDKINKPMMKRLLALYLVSADLHPISFGYISENRRVLQSAMSKFYVTIFKPECSQHIWVDCKSKVNAKEANITNKNYQITKFNLQHIEDLQDEDCTKLLWLLDKCPLIVNESPAVYEALKLCSDRRFVVLTNNKSLNLEEHLVFSKLSDLKIHFEIFHDLLSSFKCVLFKTEITLAQIYNEEFQDDITTNELLLMVDKHYEIKQENEDLPETYIQRCLTRKIIDFKFLDNVDKDTLVFISNVQKLKDLQSHKTVEVKKYLNNKFSKQQIVYTSEDQDSQLLFKNICDKPFYKSYHHLKMFEGKLEWIKSYGPISSLKQYNLEDCLIEEKELAETNIQHNIHVVVGDPGLGKSCFLKNLKNSLLSKTVVILFSPQDMKQICNFIKTSKDKLDDFLIDLKYSNWDKLDRCVVKQFMKENTIIYLWDALDEIVSDEERSIILDVVKKNSEKGRVQWMTCRRHLKNNLETELNVLSRTLIEYDKTQQTSYIQRRLESVCPDVDERKRLTNKILKMVSILKNRDILSIPLQIYMLTEICRQDKNRISDMVKGTFTLVNLYEYFVDQKLNFYYKKNSLDDSILNNFKEEKIMFIKEIENAALETILENCNFVKLNVDIDEDLRGFNDKIGFLTVVIENNLKSTIKFSHTSFAEYFTACYLARQQTTIIKDLIFNEKYENVRFFLDLIIARNCPAHIAVLYNNLEELKKCERHIQLKDAWGRNPLHLACSWSNKWRLQHFEKCSDKFVLLYYCNYSKEAPQEYIQILDILTYSCNIYAIDKVMKMSALEYAERYSSLFALAVIANKHQTVYLNLTDKINCNILFYSVQLNVQQFIPMLKSYVNRILCGYYGDTLLNLACENKNEEMVSVLIDNGSDINALNWANCTTFMLACQKGNEKIIEILMKAGFKINASSENDRTPLMFACQSGNENIVKMLIKTKVDVNASDKDGKTPLMYACENGQEKVTEMLIKSGVNINACDKDGWTPFMYACQSGYPDIVETLIQVKVDINASDKNGWTVSTLVCQSGYDTILEILLKAGVDFSSSDKEGKTPFMYACENGHEKIVTMLIKVGVDINATAKNGWTPFMYACRWGKEKIVDILIKARVDINASDNNGWTAFMFACQWEKKNIVEMLVKANVDINASDKNGRTPLMFACESGNTDIVKILIKAKVDINAFDKDGLTPLLIACKNEDENIVEMLMKAGVIIKASDKNYWTLFTFACRRGNIDLVEMIIKAGDDTNGSDKDSCTLFMFACQSENKDIVEMLIKAGVDINASNENGCTPITFACQSGNEDIVELLIKAEVNINVSDKDGLTPLLIACKNENKNIVEMLMKAGGDINVSDKDGKTPLMFACHSQNKDIVEMLMKAKVDINASDKDGKTPFMFACQSGNEGIVEMLIKAVVDINTLDKDGLTLLLIACKSENKHIIRMLIKAGVDINASDKDGKTPFLFACRSGNEDIVEMLIKAGVDINTSDKDGWTPFMFACHSGKRNIVQMLIKAKVNINAFDKDGWTALMISCQSGNEHIVKTLIKAGVSINVCDKNGWTAFMFACLFEKKRVVKILLNAGVNINTSDKNGCTPFMYACQWGKERIVEILVKTGVDINAFDINDKTPFMLACQNENNKVVEMLLKAGVDLNASNKCGLTALIFACQNGNERIVETLIKAGVDINACDKNGWTAFMFACHFGKERIVEILMKTGVEINASDINGKTSLMIACETGNENIVEMLLKANVDINVSDTDGRTPFMFACVSGNNNIVEMLMNAGGNINATSRDRKTPFMYACNNKNENVVKMLIKAKVDNSSD